MVNTDLLGFVELMTSCSSGLWNSVWAKISKSRGQNLICHPMESLWAETYSHPEAAHKWGEITAKLPGTEWGASTGRVVYKTEDYRLVGYTRDSLKQNTPSMKVNQGGNLKPSIIWG